MFLVKFLLDHDIIAVKMTEQKYGYILFNVLDWLHLLYS